MTTKAGDEIVLKLLHTADWHLGRRFPGFDNEEQEHKLTRARLDVLDRILGLAERHDVHGVLCAGDVFDDPTPLPEWWEPVVAHLKKRNWKNRPLFFLPGNHDPLLPESVWASGHKFRASLPEWVHVIDRVPFEFELANGAVLYAVPCRSRAGQGDPTLEIPRRQSGDERIRIGMVHGSTYDVPDRTTNFPISRDAAVDCGLDYLALGDTHGFRFVPPDRREPPTIYPGTPEPTAFDEVDPGKVALVLVTRRRKVSVQPEPVATWTWEQLEVTSMDGLRQLRARTDLERRVLRLHVSLTATAPDYEEAERILDDLLGTVAKRGRVGVLQLDRSGLMLDTSTIHEHCNNLPPVLQTAVESLRSIADGPDVDRAAVAHRALFHLYQTSKKAS